MRRRKKKSALDRIILGAAKQIRKQRLDFEREASKALSEALGFLVVVKIQKRSPTADLSPDMRRARRKSPDEIKALVLDQLRALDAKPEETNGSGDEPVIPSEPLANRRRKPGGNRAPKQAE